METTPTPTLARTCKLLGVTDRELAALRGVFARHDLDGDGALDAAALPALLGAPHARPPLPCHANPAAALVTGA